MTPVVNPQAPPATTAEGASPAAHARGSRRYCLVTPCRNEAAYIRRTLDSTIAQTVPPTRWVIVDDGSTDETPAILAEYAAKHDFITVVQKEDRGHRAVGPGVIEAFYQGLAAVELDDYDYVCKYDGDLEMPPRYFERVMERMEEDPCLGNLSGKLYGLLGDGRMVPERTGDENAVGPVKFYRVECFKDIGGFVREVSWDGIDGHVCRMRGWIASSVDDPEMRISHLRAQGSSQGNIWVGRLRWGRGKYFMGSRWYYVLAASGYRMFERPWIIGGLGILLGYLRAAISRHPRYDDPEYLAYFRRTERRALLRGRGRTLEELNVAIREAKGRKDPDRDGT